MGTETDTTEHITHDDLVALRDRVMRADHHARAEAVALSILATEMLQAKALRLLSLDAKAVSAADRFDAVQRLGVACNRAQDLMAPSCGRLPLGDRRFPQAARDAIVTAIDGLATLADIVATQDHETAKVAARDALAFVDKATILENARDSHWASWALARSFQRTLGDAPNFVEVHCDDNIVVTVQRIAGESPASLVAKLRHELDAARAVKP